MFNISDRELNSKLNELTRKVERTQTLFGNASQHEWKDIFELCDQIAENFKNVRYPSKQERDIAWQNFYNLRNAAYETKRKQSHTKSSEHYNYIMGELKSANYDAIGDFLIGRVFSLGLLKTTADEMKAKGRELSKIGGYFKSVKHEMTNEHKSEIHQRMIEIRENHDAFWGKYKSYQAEKSQLYEQKQRNWEEKQQKSRQIKERIESNLSSNREKLSKAKDALYRFERNRDELRDKIYESTNYNWKSKAEGWLDEANDKISDIKDQIDRIEGWINEDIDKLRNWN